jgi:hypothetical protein
MRTDGVPEEKLGIINRSGDVAGHFRAAWSDRQVRLAQTYFRRPKA